MSPNNFAPSGPDAWSHPYVHVDPNGATERLETSMQLLLVRSKDLLLFSFHCLNYNRREQEKE